MRRVSAGFSLLEIIIVLAIAGLLMTLVPPAFEGVLQGKKLHKTAYQVAAELKLARQEAITLQQTRQLRFDMDSRQISSADGVELSLPSDTRLTVEAALSSLKQGRSLDIRFYPDGSSSGGSIRLMQNRQSYQITVNWITGQVYVEQKNRAG